MDVNQEEAVIVPPIQETPGNQKQKNNEAKKHEQKFQEQKNWESSKQQNNNRENNKKRPSKIIKMEIMQDKEIIVITILIRNQVNQKAIIRMLIMDTDIIKMKGKNSWGGDSIAVLVFFAKSIQTGYNIV